jgi:hypothetical protein
VTDVCFYGHDAKVTVTVQGLDIRWMSVSRALCGSDPVRRPASGWRARPRSIREAMAPRRTRRCRIRRCGTSSAVPVPGTSCARDRPPTPGSAYRCG